MIKLIRFVFLILVIVGLNSTQLLAEERAIVEGEDYQVLGPVGSKSPEVLEFFSYACGHCYTMETLVNKFKKNNPDIKIIPVPTDLGHPQWQIYVKAFYLGELLKVLDQSHTKIFHRINVEKKHITNDEQLKVFFVALGVDPLQYDKALKSFSLDAKIRKAKQLTRTYQIAETPIFIANRRFKLNNPKLGSTDMIDKALRELTQVGF